MLLTISTSVSPATDLGFRSTSILIACTRSSSPSGSRVCFPEASVDRCTAADRRHRSRRAAVHPAGGDPRHDVRWRSDTSTIGRTWRRRSWRWRSTSCSGRRCRAAVPTVRHSPTRRSRSRCGYRWCPAAAAALLPPVQPLGYHVTATPIAARRDLPRVGRQRLPRRHAVGARPAARRARAPVRAAAGARRRQALLGR